MPFKATELKLPENISQIIEKISSSMTLPSNLVQRAKIILYASMGFNNMEISKMVGLSQNKASKWRMRFVEKLPYLTEVASSNPDKLEEEVFSSLEDLRRSGHPRKYTQEQILRIQEIACRPPKEYGYELSRWSLPKLREAVIKEGIVDDIGVSSIRSFLKGRQDTSA